MRKSGHSYRAKNYQYISLTLMSSKENSTLIMFTPGGCVQAPFAVGGSTIVAPLWGL